MNVLSRITRLFKADIHGVMDQLEDKELLVKQYLREMETSLQNKEMMLRQFTEEIGIHASKEAETLKEINKLEEDLELAVRKDKDDIARMLIRKQHTLKIIHHNLEKKREGFDEEKEKLSSQLEEQRVKYESLKAKATLFCHRQGSSFGFSDTPYNSSDSTNTIDDNEVELELIRLKELLQKNGGGS